MITNKNDLIKSNLIKMSDETYKIFISKLLPNINNILGVRIPNLRKLAKQISNENWKFYLDNAKDNYFEEIMLQGLVIGYVSTDFNTISPYIEKFVKKINNWSICDTFCFNLKIFNTNPSLKFINKYFYSENEFDVRFSVVILLRWFNKKNLLNQNLKILDSIKNNNYYAKMAIAWAISTFFVTDSHLVLNYLKNNNLDNFIQNKAIQKIIDSSKVANDLKLIVRQLYRYN